MTPDKSKSKKQVAYLLSKASPLSKKKQGKLKDELHSGAVKVKKEKMWVVGQARLDLFNAFQTYEKQMAKDHHGSG